MLQEFLDVRKLTYSKLSILCAFQFNDIDVAEVKTNTFYSCS